MPRMRAFTSIGARVFEGLPGEPHRENMKAKEISNLLATEDGVMLVSAFT